MQLTIKNIYQRGVIGIAAFIWVLGLLTAGSDSMYMPWLNAVGAIVFLLASLWLGRLLPRLESSGSLASPSKLTKKKVFTGTRILPTPLGIKQSSPMNTRYGGGWSPV